MGLFRRIENGTTTVTDSEQVRAIVFTAVIIGIIIGIILAIGLL